MTCTRNPCADWLTPYFAEDSLGPQPVTNPILIHDDILWVQANNNYPSLASRQNFLFGLDIHTGASRGTIPITGLNGKDNWGNFDLAIDNNKKIWVQGEPIISGSNTAIYVVNPESRLVEQSILTATTTAWQGRTLHHDPNNNLMWAIQNATTYAAISTETFTVVKTIVPVKLGSEIFNGRALDTKQSELWFFWGTNKILIYSTTTGNLLRTLTSSFTGSNTAINYIPERNSMVIYSNADDQHEIWSTETYTKTSTIPSSIQHALKYVPKCDRLVGKGLGGPNPFGWPAFLEFDSPHTVSNADDPFNLPVDAVMVRIYTVDDQGSVYFRIYDDSNFLFYIAKISYGYYNSVPIGDEALYTNEADTFNRELILDLDLNAFFINDLGHSGLPAIYDYVPLPGYVISSEEVAVLAGTDPVIITSGDSVVVSTKVGSSRPYNPRGERFKYLTIAGTSFTLSEYKSFNFRDYESFDASGSGFPSYILTGYDMHMDMMRKKRSIYLLVYCERTETVWTLNADEEVVLSVQSGCVVQSQWEWANSAATGKWGKPFQAYKLLRNIPSNPTSGDELDYGEKVIVTKNKLRGNGRALSLFIQAECGKDLKLLGWGLDMTKQDTP